VEVGDGVVVAFYVDDGVFARQKVGEPEAVGVWHFVVWDVV